MHKQITSTLLMVRPTSFHYNEQTAANNYYQKVLSGVDVDMAQERALAEFDNFVSKLMDHGIQVIVVQDTDSSDTPDSIFPNNWVSFHEDGRTGLYPMFAENRRAERRLDILDLLTESYHFEIKEKVDFTGHEDEGHFLEGTGSVLLDRQHNIAYAALSERTDERVLKAFCERFTYSPVSFMAYQSTKGQRLPIYHTNVMMCLAEEFAVICADSIDDLQEKETVLSTLRATGKEIMTISEDQVRHFAGNMLQVMNNEEERFMVMSSSAYHSLEAAQKELITAHCPIIHSSLDTIEALGGGSARCMMAEIFLPLKT